MGKKRVQGDTDMKVNRLCAENPFSLTGNDVGPSARMPTARSVCAQAVVYE